MKRSILIICAIIVPGILLAQGHDDTATQIQRSLDGVYNQMIKLCEPIMNVGRGIAGFAATWYIASRVWGHIARAEPIDFYPLFRPFFIGFCIINFNYVLLLINGILTPTVSATNEMVKYHNEALFAVIDGQKSSISQTPQDAPAGTNTDPDKWYKYDHPDNTTAPAGVSSNPISDAFSVFNLKSMVRRWIAELLELCYEAAVLCIDTIRTFKLIILAILGPIAFGLGIFDGFQHTIKHWMARYINVFMWLPVANVFGAVVNKIQENMIRIAESGGNTDPFSNNTNTFYLIFLLIAIVGYFTVPSIAGYIINVGGHALFSKTAAIASTATSVYTGTVMRQTSSNTERSRELFYSKSNPASGSSTNTGNDNGYMANKLSGKT